MFKNILCKIGFHQYGKWEEFTVPKWTHHQFCAPTIEMKNVLAQKRFCKCCNKRQMLIGGVHVD